MKKPDSLKLEVEGVRCDTPDCGYQLKNLNVVDYEDLVGKPCPNCDADLLTMEDFNLFKFLTATNEMAIDV